MIADIRFVDDKSLYPFYSIHVTRVNASNASTLLQDYGLDDVISAVYTPSPLSSVVISEATPPPPSMMT